MENIELQNKKHDNNKLYNKDVKTIQSQNEIIKTNELEDNNNETNELEDNNNDDTHKLEDNNNETNELENNNNDTNELENNKIETIQSQNENIETFQSQNENIETFQFNIKNSYIENDQLSRDFSLCDESKIYKIHCVVYGIDSMYIEGPLELNEIKQNYYNTFLYNKYYNYIKYAMKLINNEWVFDSFDYICPTINNKIDITMYKNNNSFSSNGEDEKNKSINAHFETECYKKVFEMFKNTENLHKVSNINFYKGFIEYNENNIFVFFDISELYHDLKSEYKSILMNEFLNEYRTSYNIPINNTICDFFYNNNSIHKIKTIDKQYIPLPQTMYLCELNGDQFLNIKNNNIEKLKYFYNYDKLVPGFYFTELIQYDNGLNENLNLLKCAVFMVNSLDLGIDIDDLVREDEDHKYLLNYQTICYNDSNIKMFSVKNISHFSIL